MIRPFDGSLSDAEGLLAVERATFDDCPYTPAEVQALLCSGEQHTWVAVEQDCVAGFVIAFAASSLRGVWWEIDLLAVHPDWEGRGLGGQLIRTAVAAGASRASQTRAVVAADNTRSARAFTRAGFRTAGPICALLICRLGEGSVGSRPAPGVTLREGTPAQVAQWTGRPPLHGPPGTDLAILVAEQAGRPAGYVELVDVQTLLYRGLWIESLHAPRRAVRSTLLWGAIERARAAGMDEISAMVPAANLSLQSALLSAGARSLGAYRWFTAPLPLYGREGASGA